MRSSYKLAATAAAACGALVLAGLPAAAKCTRLGFSVNDYGKDGPTKDAKALLDTHIAKWAAEHKIAKYTTGKKDVNCELFLNFIVFDEHTCRAEATVCWDDKAPGALPTQDAAVQPPAEGKKKAVTVPAVKAPAAKPPLQAKADKPHTVETSAIPARKPEAAAPALEADKADKAIEAAAAAARAAAAAERAAAAAERAAAVAVERSKAAAAMEPAATIAITADPKPAPKAAPIAPSLPTKTE